VTFEKKENKEKSEKDLHICRFTVMDCSGRLKNNFLDYL
jgi:hypothetical protein